MSIKKNATFERTYKDMKKYVTSPHDPITSANDSD